MDQMVGEAPWAGVPQSWGHPWHAMCSYLGSFPAPMARSLICMLSGEGDVVLDPFCGRGTTLLEARLLGRVPLASDLNPLAVALTRAKNVTVSLKEVIDRIDDLKQGFDLALWLPEAFAQTDDILLIYHPAALAKLCYLRQRLLRSTASVDRFLVGIVLGIMHGNERKDGSSSYASISMPNTFSMPPRYVRRFVQNRGLQRVDRDVFELLANKAVRLFRLNGEFRTAGIVTRADAKTLTSVDQFREYVGGVDLVVTSPPYLDVVEYAKQNWIRMWFLGKDPVEVSKELDDTLAIRTWLDFIETVAIEIRNVLRPQGVAVLVIGDVVRSANSVISPAREAIRRFKHANLFQYIGCINDYAYGAEKTTRVWRETKGQATNVDRILVLSDHPPEFRTDHLGRLLYGDMLRSVPPVSAAEIAEYARSFSGMN